MNQKQHYILLDGLRGVAALMVVCYHFFEGFATSPADQKFNHGYLAVDFFFVLSGFVIGYAYDDRWKSMKVKEFFRRRIVRLHPMVILGAILGVISFCIQGCVKWDGTPVSPMMVILAMVLGMLMLPVFPGTGPEVRGNGEMFPLNGPSWSLFFEYIGNIMYALFLRRLPTRWLTAFTALYGASLAAFTLANGSGFWNVGVGWTFAGHNFIGGFLRMSFSFSAGLLLSRNYRKINVKGAFWICALVIVSLLSVPYLGGEKMPWINGIFDLVCILGVFPSLVLLGAGGSAEGKVSSKICSFVGEISYPLYIIHYPFMYLFYAYVWKHGLAFSDVWYIALGIFATCILTAYAASRLYDRPVRRWLSRRAAQES
ncbi:MAG: acyltransferase family protein [Candidatus Cryptobacteroides sp.]